MAMAMDEETGVVVDTTRLAQAVAAEVARRAEMGWRLTLNTMDGAEAYLRFESDYHGFTERVDVDGNMRQGFSW